LTFVIYNKLGVDIMIINFKINNFRGIEKEAILSALASNKIHRANNKCISIDNKTKLLKTLCLIGCNGSGKTSVLYAFQTIKDFVFFPFRKMMNEDEEYIKYIRSLSEDELKNHLAKLNTLSLGKQNINKSTEETEIEIELYIPKRKANIDGIYTYKLIYNKDYRSKGVILEKLSYRPKMEKRNIITLCKKEGIIESQIGTTILYEKNDSKNRNTKYIEYYKSFADELLNHSELLTNGVSVDIKEVFENNKKDFVKLCNIADDKITNVTIDENDDKRNILFWNKDNNHLYFSQLSDGTKKVIVLGSIIIKALNNNSILFIDELEQSLHPTLVEFLIELATSKSNNNYTQLIFTTHSPLLAFTMENDELYFISNHNDEYFFSNISNAIRKKIITKDQSRQKAWVGDLLIKNPDKVKIKEFIENKN
jgi:hypothetical protein